ncbi:MAG: sulfite exporter TauE/SafE family protein, partial [Candidatus Niyogibacteria bacterium]|nr:sulfite exporter TauE/SafE family protein [Candidatus Niyogibacteria bacterium]
KAAFIATVAAAGFLIDTARLATYVWSGAAMDRALAENLLFYIPASFAGVWIGERILQHIPQERFRFIVAAFLVLVGIKFAFFP